MMDILGGVLKPKTNRHVPKSKERVSSQVKEDKILSFRLFNYAHIIINQRLCFSAQSLSSERLK